MDQDLAETVHRAAQRELGIALRTERETDRVHGSVQTLHKFAGHPFATLQGYRVTDGVGVPFTAQVDDCPFCKTRIPRERAHDCVRVHTYGQDVGPTHSRLSTLLDPDLSEERRGYLEEIVNDFRQTAERD